MLGFLMFQEQPGGCLATLLSTHWPESRSFKTSLIIPLPRLTTKRVRSGHQCSYWNELPKAKKSSHNVLIHLLFFHLSVLMLF